jgi:outer membrane protein OmpA-like peptidoglycan-associated protein
MKWFTTAGALGLALTIAACSTLPERIESLEDARSVVQQAAATPGVESAAPDELARAQAALGRADALKAKGEDIDLIQHDAYLAKRYAQAALALVAADQADERVAALEDERERIVLRNREREANAAALAAASAQMRAETAEQRADALASRLQSMQAEETERGTVLTLSDVLFETDRAQLKPGAAASMDRLARFLGEYPDRRVLIEGHTDSRGTAAYNLQLSRDRADAVRDALVLRGIDASRILTTGKGESLPVASNDTAAGRQANRRVDIVISDADGQIADASEPEPSLP